MFDLDGRNRHWGKPSFAGAHCLKPDPKIGSSRLSRRSLPVGERAARHSLLLGEGQVVRRPLRGYPVLSKSSSEAHAVSGSEPFALSSTPDDDHHDHDARCQQANGEGRKWRDVRPPATGGSEAGKEVVQDAVGIHCPRANENSPKTGEPPVSKGFRHQRAGERDDDCQSHDGSDYRHDYRRNRDYGAQQCTEKDDAAASPPCVGLLTHLSCSQSKCRHGAAGMSCSNR
jgi:hypothetical protein